MCGTTVLFLHGINDYGSSSAWLAALDRALVRQGLESVGDRSWSVLAPRYSDLLAGTVPEAEAPATTYRKNGDAAQRAEIVGDYWARLADLERALRDLPRPDNSDLIGRLGDAGAVTLVKAFLEQAEKYRRHEGLRDAVLRRVLTDLPAEGELVVLAHSLGSVVLADLLMHLPPRLKISLIVTMGSPLSHGMLRKHLSGLNESFPFEVAGPWVNLVGHNDPVTASRGVSGFFPEVVDVFVDNGGLHGAHDAVRYLEQEAVVRALGWVDHPGIERVETSNLPDVPMTEALLAIVVGMQYALRVEQALDYGEKRARYAAARRLVADEVAAEWRATGTNHPVLGRLLRDNASVIKSRFPQETAVTYLLTAWQSNVLRPFEVEVDEAVRRRALMNLAMDLELPSSFAETIIRAYAAARSSQEEGFSWIRAGVIVAGVVTVLAAPALVFAVAPAGLAGGAALVAGLATLGPGGMLGGLAVIGLVGGVGGSLAVSALTGGSSAEVIDVVIFLQARAKALRDLRSDRSDLREWQILHQMAATVSNDLRRQQQASDRGSTPVKEAERKLKALRRSLDWMDKNDLAPAALPASPTAFAALPVGTSNGEDHQ